MRLLADENIPLAAVRALRVAGHDVYSATESAPGGPDEALFAFAVGTDRIVLTFDLDFGALAARGPTPIPGVILLRLVPASGERLATLLLDLLLAFPESSWRDHLSIVTAEHIRRRRLIRAA